VSKSCCRVVQLVWFCLLFLRMLYALMVMASAMTPIMAVMVRVLFVGIMFVVIC